MGSNISLLCFSTLLLASAESISISMESKQNTAGRNLRSMDENVEEQRLFHLVKVFASKRKNAVHPISDAHLSPQRVQHLSSKTSALEESSTTKFLWGAEERKFATKKKARNYLTSPGFKKMYKEVSNEHPEAKDAETVKALVGKFGESEVAQMLRLGQTGTVPSRKERDIAYRLEKAQFQLWFDENKTRHTAKVVEEKTNILLSDTSRKGKNAWVQAVLEKYRDFFNKRIPETDPRHPGR